MTPTTTDLDHAEYCLPRPGNDLPRVETFPYSRDDGRVARITRCVECGVQTVVWLGKL